MPLEKTLLTLPPNPRTRKRTLYRKYLVSLEVRRRTPTRLKNPRRPSRRRRRETRHDPYPGGDSSKHSPPRSLVARRRSIPRRHAREHSPRSTALAASAAALSRSVVGDRGQARSHR